MHLQALCSGDLLPQASDICRSLCCLYAGAKRVAILDWDVSSRFPPRGLTDHQCSSLFPFTSAYLNQQPAPDSLLNLHQAWAHAAAIVPGLCLHRSTMEMVSSCSRRAAGTSSISASTDTGSTTRAPSFSQGQDTPARSDFALASFPMASPEVLPLSHADQTGLLPAEPE